MGKKWKKLRHDLGPFSVMKWSFGHITDGESVQRAACQQAGFGKDSQREESVPCNELMIRSTFRGVSFRFILIASF